ncbi:MAG: TIGR00730 family Rossman fold protein [Xanthobacteraceae bacterium]
MKIAVFCGSNVGASEVYRAGAAALGRALAEQNIELVFGGTSKGLMKIVADAVIDNGGVAHGVITRGLVDKGQQYDRLTIAEIVPTRALRKARMAEVADGFVAMPGGIGTVEELFEMWVDAQFEGNLKPLGVYNLAGFFDHLLLFVDTMIDCGFLPREQKNMIVVATDPHTLIERFRNHSPVTVSKWL